MRDIYRTDDFTDAVETIRSFMLGLSEEPHYQRILSYALENLDIVADRFNEED